MKAEQELSCEGRVSDISAFEEGDVYLYDPSVKRGQAEKLSRLWKEPFVVERVYDAVDVRIRPIGGGLAQGVRMDRLKLCDRSSMTLQREESRRQRGDPVSESEYDEGEGDGTQGDFEVIFEEPEARTTARERRQDPLVELQGDELTDINDEDEDEELESEPDFEGEQEAGDEEEAERVVEARLRRNAGPPARLRDYVVDFDRDDEQ